VGIFNYKEISISFVNSDLDSISIPKPSLGEYPSGLLSQCRPGRFDGDHRINIFDKNELTPHENNQNQSV